ncbi:PaaI family thioesterase [Microbacterium sp. BWT-B31]|uniref:PaaI family thioesterase n=1 Tax=Microbacterium sp. BWT-B31 TaxID=3232072 RepID=UPI003527DF06
MTSIDGLGMMRIRLRSDDGTATEEYPELLADLRGLLDSFARADPRSEEVRELRRSIEAMRRITDARAVAEEGRPFGSGGLGADDQRMHTAVPELQVESLTPAELRASVTFGDYFLGVNGATHGGIVAAAFDEALGRLAAGVSPCRTASLSVAFRAVTPIGRRLDIRATVGRIEGRKCFVHGKLLDGGVVCAEADALFIELRPGQA